MSDNLRGAAWILASCVGAVIIVSTLCIAEREARRGRARSQL